jgi:hypothetical protein
MALRYNRYTVSFLQHHHGSSSIAWYVSGDSTVIFGSPTEEDNTQEELFDSLMDGGGVDFCEGRGLHFLSLIKAELQYRMTTKEEENQRALMGTPRGHNVVKRSLEERTSVRRETVVRFVHCQFSEWNALLRNLARKLFTFSNNDSMMTSLGHPLTTASHA